MIELMEASVKSSEQYYRKSLIIFLSGGYNYDSRLGYVGYRVLKLETRNSYPYPLSKKRHKWRLLEKFCLEGCTLVRTTLWCNEFQEHGERIKLDLYDVIRLGHIYDSNIVKELEMVDKKS